MSPDSSKKNAASRRKYPDTSHLDALDKDLFDNIDEDFVKLQRTLLHRIESQRFFGCDRKPPPNYERACDHQSIVSSCSLPSTTSTDATTSTKLSSMTSASSEVNTIQQRRSFDGLHTASCPQEQIQTNSTTSNQHVMARLHSTAKLKLPQKHFFRTPTSKRSNHHTQQLTTQCSAIM